MDIDQALSSFNNMASNSEAANGKDIEAYRSYVEKRIDPRETRFLEHSMDLVAVSRRRGSVSTVGGAGHGQSAAIGLPLILVLPLMVFGIVPGLLGRLFIMVLMGAAEVRMVTSTPELMELMTIKEWAVCASV